MLSEFDKLKKYSGLKWLLFIMPIPWVCLLILLLYVGSFDLLIDNIIVFIGLIFTIYIIYLSIIFIKDVLSIVVSVYTKNNAIVVEVFSGKKYLLDALKLSRNSKEIIKQKSRNLDFLLPDNGSFAIVSNKGDRLYVSSLMRDFDLITNKINEAGLK